MSEQGEHTLVTNGKQATIPFGNTTIACKFLDMPVSNPYFLQVDVMNPADKEEVIRSLQDSVRKRFWFLDEGIQNEQLQERLGIMLGDGVEVDIYNFQHEPLSTDSRLSKINRALTRYYKSLKDKSLWNLESIQIRAEDVINKKSGQSYRGREFPQQYRFELFPTSFKQGYYRDSLNCSWIEGSIGHETTHIVLEDTLRRLWKQHFEKLGWESLPPLTLVRLPGGFETTRANRDYRNLPTEYASYQEDDDRAESAVAFLSDHSKLNRIRMRLLSSVFDTPPHDVVESEVLIKDAKLPEIPALHVYLHSIAGLFSRVGAVRKSIEEPRIITLEQYRKSF